MGTVFPAMATLLLNTPHTLVIGHREMELVLPEASTPLISLYTQLVQDVYKMLRRLSGQNSHQVTQL